MAKRKKLSRIDPITGDVVLELWEKRIESRNLLRLMDDAQKKIRGQTENVNSIL